MKILMRRLALFLALAAVSNLLAVAALPRLINGYVMYRIAALAGGSNLALHAPRANANARTVVRPSPDLLYTACVFDVSEHPLRISAPVQDSYVSVSMFAADTSNFFAINDAVLQPGADGRKYFDLILTKGDVGDVPSGVQIIKAPSTKGLILFRSLITDEGDLARLQKDFQAQQRCAPI
jgi:uncharacterized membrane protein